MISTSLLEQFNRLSDAPDAVGNFRRFVLDLGVRGRLSDVDKRDEPAHELLRRIEQAKADTATKTRRKRDVAVQPPFEVRANWVWTTIGQVTAARDQTVPKQPFTYIDVTAIDKERGKIGDARVLTPEEAPSRARKLVQKGDVLYSCVRPYLLNVAVVDKEIEPFPIASTAFAVLHGFGLVVPRYMWIALRSPFMVEAVESRMRGQAYPAINDSDFATLPFPLPPLAEQHRIVAKVDELMALCDRLETAQADRTSRLDTFVNAAHASVNQKLDRNNFQQTARFFVSNLRQLSTRLEDIRALRQTILNLGVSGLLLEQEKTAGLIRSADADCENPLEMTTPEKWRWVRLEEVADCRLGKMLDAAKNTGTPYRYLRNTNVHWFEVRLNDLKSLRLEESEVSKYLLQEGDILICEGGHGIGRTAVWRAKDEDVVFQKALHRVRPGPALDSDFFAFCMSVYFHSGILRRHFTGVGIPHLTGQSLGRIVFPLPPIDEQRQIVTKVKVLHHFCDRIAAQIETNHQISGELLRTVCNEALNRNSLTTSTLRAASSQAS